AANRSGLGRIARRLPSSRRRKGALAGDVIAMQRHGRRQSADLLAPVLHRATQTRDIDVVDERVVAPGIEVLAEEDRNPARLPVRLLREERHPGAARPYLDLMPQR